MKNSLRSPPSSLLVCGNCFVFSLSQCSFVTVSDGMEFNKEVQVMFCNWVYHESSYAV